MMKLGGVLKKLDEKKYPQNFRALRLVVEELLHDAFKSNNISDFNELLSILENIGSLGRTVKLWLDAAVKLLFIMMKFLRVTRKADSFFHISAVK